MSPQSLLFSSDQEASRRLIQALEELELEVVHRPEIFGAIEQLTNRSFDVIVSDLDQGLEAGFLLKTARELKLNKDAFTLAVAGRSAFDDAEKIGADMVLAKPIIPDQAKFALLTCERFLACMRTWLSRPDFPTTPKVAPPPQAAPPAVMKKAPPAPVAPVTGGRLPAARPSTPSQPPARTLPKAASSPKPPTPPIVRKPPTAKPPTPHVSPAAVSRHGSNSTRFLWATAIAVVVLSIVYSFSSPLEIRGSLISFIPYRHVLVETYERTAEALRSRSHGPDSAPAVVATAITPAPVVSPPLSSPVTTAAVGRTVLPARSLTGGSNPPPTAKPAVTVVQLQSDYPPAIPKTGHIPDSIRLPQSETDAVRSTVTKLATPLLDELGPVSLSEDISEQLLLQKVQPGYPEQALRAGLQGAVVLQAWIGTDGNVRDLKLVRGSLLLGQAAYKAVKQWRYKPYLVNGKAVEAQTFVTINFRLPQQSLMSPYPH